MKKILKLALTMIVAGNISSFAVRSYDLLTDYNNMFRNELRHHLRATYSGMMQYPHHLVYGIGEKFAYKMIPINEPVKTYMVNNIVQERSIKQKTI